MPCRPRVAKLASQISVTIVSCGPSVALSHQLIVSFEIPMPLLKCVILSISFIVE
jgi:hypothetical protein